MRIFVCCCGSGTMAAVGARKGSGREEMNAGENKVKWEKHKNMNGKGEE